MSDFTPVTPIILQIRKIIFEKFNASISAPSQNELT